ncbi:MAG: acyl--CoA ligase [Pseudomonadales bacterium]|nr:acyl--CoA ligase [Pseudomonadales bacterium]
MTVMLSEIVSKNAQEQAQEPAFILHDSAVSLAISWLQYDRSSSLLALKLAELSLAQGAVVAVLLADGPLSHIAFLACEKAGLIALGLSPRAGQQEFCHLMQHAQASAIITHEQHDGISSQQRCDWLAAQKIIPVIFPEAFSDIRVMLEAADSALAEPQTLDDLHPLRLRDPQQMFLINSTSGTTGLPKCVIQNQSRWFYFHSLVLETAELGHDDVIMSLLPAAVGFGLWTSHFTPAIMGASTVLLPKFDVEETLDAIEKHGVTVLAAVSTQFIMLLNSPSFSQRDFSSLRILYTGGERVPYERAKAFEDQTAAKVLQFYGSNETGALSCTTIHDSQEKRLTTAGRPIPAMQLQLLDNDGNDVTSTGFGQPICKGPALSLGYYRDDRANQSLYHDNGAIKTGDLAQIDDEGYLSVCGRQGDFIIRGGKNISGPAVEEACLLHPSIQQAAVVAMADEIFGERVCLFAVLHDGSQLTLAMLLKFLADNGCSKENFPERLELLTQLPQSSGGKVSKAELKKILDALLSNEALSIE